MGGGTSRGRWLCTVIGLLTVVAGAALPARGQSPLDYRTADPRLLIRALKTAPREERNAIASAMVARRAQVLPALRDTARSGDRAEKMLACSLIAEMRDRESLDAVLAATGDGDVKVRRRAATTLRILADRRAANRLRELLGSESDLGVLQTAIVALGRLGQARDLLLIAPFLTHTDHGVRVVAAGALAMLGDERGVDLVVQATFSTDPGVQQSATYALGLFRAAVAGGRLQAILDDPNGAWKSYALIAQAERQLAAESTAEQVATLQQAAQGRSRGLAEWAVDRLTDIGDADAAAALRVLRDRKTPVGKMAERRLDALEARP